MSLRAILTDVRPHGALALRSLALLLLRRQAQ
jgi:hypothetical protein